MELDSLHREEESYWHIRVRANELREGDRNTTYFHRKASQRLKKNEISKIKDRNDVWKDSKAGIEDVVVDFYTELFCASSEVDMEKAIEEELARLLGVKRVERHNKYLGFPTFFDRSKKAIFEGVIDRIRRRLNDWKEKALSQAGKEVLFKEEWRLLCNQGSLAYWVLKARYFRNFSFYEASRGHAPSYTWRSIWGVKSLLIEGLGWLVGNGVDINLWANCWLPDMEGSGLCRPSTDHLPWLDLSLRVVDLLNEERNGWDVNNVMSFLFLEDVKAIMKVKLFAWSLYSGALSVKSNLHLKHVVDSATCDQCALTPESIPHAIFACPASLKAWEDSLCSPLLSELSGLSPADAVLKVVDLLGINGVYDFLTHAWVAWYCRNAAMFREEFNVAIVREGFVKLAADFLKSTSKNGSGVPEIHGVGECSWFPPTGNFIKMNTNVAFLGNGVVGLGAVFRNSDGTVIGRKVQRISSVFSPLLAELEAVRMGLMEALRRGFTLLVAKTDALQIANSFNGSSVVLATWGLILDDIRYLSSRFALIMAPKVAALHVLGCLRCALVLAKNTTKWLGT
ncbi:hypothetical protein V2J09_015485 [Rumex salicifolius]